MALYRLAFVFGLGMLSGLSACSDQKPSGQTVAKPVVEVMPAAKATADVDRRATLALKQNLMTLYPQKSPTADVEFGLINDGFECGANPSAPVERACLKAMRQGTCEINTIVRTKPYAPEKAQVIKICEIGAVTPTPN
jgi:hypothetical protein